MKSLRQRRRILGEIFVTIRIPDCIIRVGDCKIPCRCLSVRKVIGTRDNIEVTHFMDQRASFRVRAGHWGRPEGSAEINIIGLIRIHVGVHVRLRARAIKVDIGVIHRIGDGCEIVSDRVISSGSKHTKPGRVS